MSHQCSQNQQLQRQVDKATESVDMQWTHTRSGHMPWRAASRTGVVAGHEKRRVFHLVARWPSRQCRPVVHLRHRCRPREIVMQHNKCDAKEGHMAPRFHHRRLQHHLRRTHRHTHTHTHIHTPRWQVCKVQPSREAGITEGRLLHGCRWGQSTRHLQTHSTPR
jgi:hypothetical protein